MLQQEITRYMSMVSSVEEFAPTRREYHVGARFIVEVVAVQADLSDKNNMMNVWKKYGYISAVLPSWLSLNTFYYDNTGGCWGRYNIIEKSSDDGKRRVINFDYLREATPENERELVAECIRLFCEGTGYTPEHIEEKEPEALPAEPTATRSIKHEEYICKGREVILDTCKVYGVYETMLMRKSDGEEIAVMNAKTEGEALAQFQLLRSKYPVDKKPAAPAPLTGRYAKLRDDLKKALETGRAAEDANPEDGGTCNFDSPALCLPRWNAEKVKQAAKEAGTGCFIWNCYGSKEFVFTPNTRAQGNARSRNAEAVTAALRSMGYDAMDYCQMD